MRELRHIKENSLRIARIAMAAAPLLAASTLAVPVQAPISTSVPCAILQKFEGAVQILDASRTEMLDASPSAPLRCGFWVSVTSGHAEVQHRDGQTIHLSAGTFAQFPDNDTDGYFSGDQMILFKGQAYVHSPNGFREFRASTANARARIKNAQAIVVFSESNETTQLIGVERSATLENRFQPGTRIAVKPGEATDLDFSAKRVVPGTPRAVSVASMRERVLALRLGEGDRARAVEVTKTRHDRPFPSELVGNEYKPVVFPNREVNRGPASEPTGTRESRTAETYSATDQAESSDEDDGSGFGHQASYDRHILGAEESEQIEDMIAEKLATGARAGIQSIDRAPAAWAPSAKTAAGKSAPSRAAAAGPAGKKVYVRDVSDRSSHQAKRMGRDRLNQEETERVRLIEELSRLSPE